METKKIEKFFMNDNTFILLVAFACASVFAGTHMFLTYGTGIFQEIYLGEMLKSGLETGDFSAAVGFAAGFLIARVLEAPLVGILDIGGSIHTGVGIGIPALMLQSGMRMPLDNFPLALATGFGIGIVMGSIIMLVRKLVPNGIASGGTAIMMGAGNSTGRYLGPLIVISAITFGVPTGIGAIIGAALFYKMDRPIAGGAILGAMLFGGIFL